MTKASSRRRISVLAGIGISLIFVCYSLVNLDWKVFSASIISVDTSLMLVFIVTLLLTMVLRARRWHIITGLSRRDWHLVWRASCIGYGGTAIFPARAGEVMRVIHLQRTSDVSTGLAVASSIVDRLVDAVALCALVGLGLVIFVSNIAVERHFFVVAGAILLAVSVTMAFLLGGDRSKELVGRLNRGGAIGFRLSQWLGQAFSELQSLRNWRILCAIAGLQVAISFLDVLACWILLWAFGWSLPIAAALVTLICLAMVSALPSTPGYIGVYQVAAMAALHEFGLARSEALAYGTLLQVCNFGLFLVAGSWAYMTTRR